MYSEMSVDEIVSTDLVTCSPQDSLRRAAGKMQSLGCGSILVVEHGQVLGIWTEADTMNLQFNLRYLGDITLGDVMSHPVISINRDANLTELDLLYSARGIRHCLVKDESDLPYGIVTRSDLVFNIGVKHYLSLRNLKSVRLDEIARIKNLASLADAVDLMKISTNHMVIITDRFGNDDSILTQRGLVQLIAEGSTHLPLSAINLHPMVEISDDCTLLDGYNTLKRKQLRCLKVVNRNAEKCGFICMNTIHQTIELEYTSQLRDLINDSGRALEVSTQHLNLARRVIDASLNSIMITDPDDQIVSINPAFTRVTGYSASEVIGRNPSILGSGHHDAKFYRDVRRHVETKGNWQGEIWNRRKNGEIFPEWLSITAITDSKGKVCQYASIFTDLTQQKLVEEQIHKLAHYDELTGLVNRQMFSIELDMALEQARRYDHKLAVLVIDIDLFSQINNTLGHRVGDQVLTKYGNALGEACENHNIVSRLGGDTFAVTIPKIFELEDSLAIVNAVSKLSEQAFIVDGHELLLTTSMGIGFYPDDGTTSELLIKNANTAMYKVKEMGRNGYQFYTSSMSARTQARLDMQSRLQRAVRNNEFFLYYQPKYDLKTNKMVAMEALIRWKDKKLGLVSPEVFIPLIEQMGMIEDVTLFVLREALLQNQRWMAKQANPIIMAVNISAVHIKRGNVVADVKRILEELNYDPHYLELEITESAFIDGVDGVSQMLRDLRDLGASIAIDDFGTGYSSLSYLKKIPADILKIDASFVREITDSHDDQQIVQAIIAMAHSLDLIVIAEGVETAAQAKFLSDNNCDQVQGYYFSRPLPSEQFDDCSSVDLECSLAAGA